MLTSIMIGNKILEARKKKNLSQSQLAQQLSVSSQAVGKWERGESMPDIRHKEEINMSLIEVAISAQGLKKSYKQLHVLKGVDLEAKKRV